MPALFVCSAIMLHAFADWVDGAGVERDVFLDDAPATARGLSAGHETLSPRFEKVNEIAAAPSGPFSLFPISAAYYCAPGEVIPRGRR